MYEIVKGVMFEKELCAKRYEEDCLDEFNIYMRFHKMAPQFFTTEKMKDILADYIRNENEWKEMGEEVHLKYKASVWGITKAIEFIENGGMVNE